MYFKYKKYLTWNSSVRIFLFLAFLSRGNCKIWHYILYEVHMGWNFLGWVREEIWASFWNLIHNNLEGCVLWIWSILGDLQNQSISNENPHFLHNHPLSVGKHIYNNFRIFSQYEGLYECWAAGGRKSHFKPANLFVRLLSGCFFFWGDIPSPIP